MRDSSNELIVELTREMLDEHLQDLREGRTPKLLEQRLKEASAFALKLDERLREAEGSLREASGEIEALKRVQDRETPLHAPPPVVIDSTHRGRHSSRPSIFAAAFKDPKAISGFIAALTVLVNVIVHLLMQGHH